jgi:hypothetical protein
MRVPMSVWKLVVMVPAMLVSGVLALMVLAVLPPVLGLLGFLAGGVVLVVLASGGLEGPAVRLLTRAREATEGERAVLAPVLVAQGGTGMPAVALYVRRAPHASTPPALVVGTSSLVVTPWLVEATYRGWITREEATAVVLHAAGRHRAGRHRLEVAVLAATTPWRAVSAVARGVGRSLAWFPFMRFAWALRGFVGAVAVVQSAVEGRAVYGAIAGVFVALTYLVPAAGRARERQLDVEGDRLVVARGLGETLAGLLRRAGIPVRLERLQRLENRPPAQPVPVLQLAAFSPN